MKPEKRIPSGALWMGFSYFAGFALQGVYFVVLARTLGASDFGVFSGALALAATFAALAGIGAGNVLVMRTARDHSQYRPQLGTALVYVSYTFLPLALMSALIGGIDADFLAVLLPLLVSELIFIRVLDFGLQAFQAHEMLKGTAIVNTSTGAIRLAAVMAFSLMGNQGAAEWAGWYAICNIFMAVIVSLICMRFFGTPRLDKQSIRETWKIGLFFSLGMASRTVYTDADKFLLVRFGLEEAAGQYSAAYKLMTMAFAPIQAIIYASNTRFFRAGKIGFEAVWQIVKRLLPPILSYSALAAVALIALSPLIPRILGPDYAEASNILLIVAPILIFQGLHYTFGDALMGVGKQAWRSIAQMVVALLSVGVNVILIPRLGWPAAAFTALGSSFLLFAITGALFAWGLRRERRQVTLADSTHPDLG